MGSRSHPRGQALIELTLTSTLILLVTMSAVGAACLILKNFKHHSVEGPSSDFRGHDQAPLVRLKKDLVFFDEKSPTRQRHILTTKGWELSSKFKLEKEKIYFFKKGDQELLLFKNLGVVTCSKNCD